MGLIKIVAPESTWSAEAANLITGTFINFPGHSTDEMLMSKAQRGELVW